MKAIRITSAALLLAACINQGYAQEASAAASSTAATASAVRASGPVSSKQLAASVRTALRNARRQGLKSSYIRVRASGAVVTLTGVVADDAQIALATRVAQGVPGVSSVDSKLKLRAVAGMKGTE